MAVKEPDREATGPILTGFARMQSPRLLGPYHKTRFETPRLQNAVGISLSVLFFTFSVHLC